MKFAGKIVGREIKDFGKGKDADAKEVHFATVKVPGRSGLPAGRFSFALTDEEVDDHQFQIGRTVSGEIDESQQQLDLNGRAQSRREKAQAAAATSKHN
jgi:hypothetical protein